jgi:hypothetical protein
MQDNSPLASCRVLRHRPRAGWLCASLLCVACFTDVGIGTRQDGYGGEGATGATDAPTDTGGSAGSTASSGGSGNQGAVGGNEPPSSSGGSRDRPVTGGAGNRGATGGTNAAGGNAPGGRSNGDSGNPATSGGTGNAPGSGGAANAGRASATGGTGNVTSSTCSTALLATPASNYTIATEFTLDVEAVKPTADLTVDWSEVKTDFRGRSVDPNELDMLELALWPLELTEFESALSSDTLNNPVLIAFMPIRDTTRANLLDLEVPDGPIPPEVIAQYFDITNYPPETNTYTIMLANGNNLGDGTRMLKAFRLDAASNTTEVRMDSLSTQLSEKVDLRSLVPQRVPAATPNIDIDWTHTETTGAGGVFIPSSITRIDVAKFSESVPELEAKFDALEDLADERYSAEVDVGTRFELVNTRDATQRFPGIDASGTWLLALSCGACENPAPWYVTILEPCAQ